MVTSPPSDHPFTDLMESLGKRNTTLGYSFELRLTDGDIVLPESARHWIEDHAVPDDVRQLWREITLARLNFKHDYPDDTGMVFWGWAESMEQTDWLREEPSDFESHDTVIGNVPGMAQYLTVSARSASEYRVLMADITTDRSEWNEVGGSIAEFLERWSEAPDYDFWSFH